MKKLISLILVLFLFACSNSEDTLYVLNWGEYIDLELVAQFEEEFNCKVVMDEVSSNEEMYTRIKAETTDYDIAVPSDYMVEKMISENMLKQIDFDSVDNQPDYFLELIDIQKIYDPNLEYTVPYFWGTIGLMYDFSVEQQVIENGWNILFEEVDGVDKVGMYNSSRDAVASALLYLGLDINTISDSDLEQAENVLKGFSYETFGSDDLKTKIVDHNLDVALVYSGDFFDQLYLTWEDGNDETFGFYVPETTNVWVDNLVIPTTSKNTELAHKFISFMNDIDNAYTNVNYVGYCPAIIEVYEIMLIPEEEWDGIIDHPFYFPLSEGTDGFVYRDLGEEHYQKLDEILINVKG